MCFSFFVVTLQTHLGLNVKGNAYGSSYDVIMTNSLYAPHKMHSLSPFELTVSLSTAV